MDTAQLRLPSTHLPPAAQQALHPTTRPPALAFIPLQRRSLLPTLLIAALLGLPAALTLLGSLWLLTHMALRLPALLGLGFLATLAAGILVAQGLRIALARQTLAQQAAHRQGCEGLYVAAEAGWLALVSSPARASFLPRDSVRCIQEVRVRYIRPNAAFCETYPCAILHDGRQVLLRLPPLDREFSLDDLLLSRWQIPAEARRIDITEDQLPAFARL